MFTGIYITDNRGTTLAIRLKDPYEHGIYVENIEGLGYPQSNITSTKFVSYDVALYKYSEIEQRSIVMTLGLIGNPSVESSRHLLYDYLPMRYPILIEFATDERCGYVRGYIETIEPDIFKDREVVQVSIVCLDPYLYAGGAKTTIAQRDTAPKFCFKKWFSEGKKPVSTILKNSLTLEVTSRFQNPPGFILTIHARTNGFNEVMINYTGGSISFSGNQFDITDEITDDMENYFNVTDDIKVYSSFENMGIYRYKGSIGTMLDITEKCNITGEFPLLSTGLNSFNAATFGIVDSYTMESVISSGRAITMSSSDKIPADSPDRIPKEILFKDSVNSDLNPHAYKYFNGLKIYCPYKAYEILLEIYTYDDVSVEIDDEGDDIIGDEFFRSIKYTNITRMANIRLYPKQHWLNDYIHTDEGDKKYFLSGSFDDLEHSYFAIGANSLVGDSLNPFEDEFVSYIYSKANAFGERQVLETFIPKGNFGMNMGDRDYEVFEADLTLFTNEFKDLYDLLYYGSGQKNELTRRRLIRVKPNYKTDYPQPVRVKKYTSTDTNCSILIEYDDIYEGI